MLLVPIYKECKLVICNVNYETRPISSRTCFADIAAHFRNNNFSLYSAWLTANNMLDRLKYMIEIQIRIY